MGRLPPESAGRYPPGTRRLRPHGRQNGHTWAGGTGKVLPGPQPGTGAAPGWSGESRGRCSQMIRPFWRRAGRFSSRVTQPPPVAMICPEPFPRSRSTWISRVRKAASPWRRRKAGMDIPARRSSSRSASTKGRPVRRARSAPVRLFPQPGIPMRIQFSISAPTWAAIAS